MTATDHPCFYGCLICLERKTGPRTVVERVADRLHVAALIEEEVRARTHRVPPIIAGD